MNTPVVLAAVNDIVDRLDSLSREEVIATLISVLAMHGLEIEVRREITQPYAGDVVSPRSIVEEEMDMVHSTAIYTASFGK